MKPTYLLFVLLWLVSAVQASSINMIQLMNRPAEEVIPVIEPMLGQGDTISGRGFKIFLRSSPETLAQVKEMVAVLDAPAKILEVSVFQGSTRMLRELSISGNIQIESGDANLNVGTGNSNHSGSIAIGADNVSGSLSGVNTQQSLQNSPVHRVRVSEGREAYIETGKQVSFFSAGLEYTNVPTGFYVLPRLHGDQVTLAVSPFKNTQSGSGDGSIETQSASTTITGKMGQWLLIGGVSERSSSTQSGIGSQVSSEGQRDESIWIKADLIQQ